MKEFIRLPYDSSGYADFGVDYVGAIGRIHFAFKEQGIAKIGELSFSFCLRLDVNGIMKEQLPLPFDVVLIDDEYIGEHNTKKYLLMLSGSDFQFEVIASGCEFSQIDSSTLISNED